jgi:hypothetical protein
LATRKKAAVLEPPVEEAETQPPQNGKDAAETEKQVILWATPGTMTERGFVPPLGNYIVWIDIDLYPDIPDFRAGIRMDIAWRVINGGEDAPGEHAMEKRCRRMSLIIPDFEGWQLLDPLTQQPIPQPDPADWATYECIAWWTGPFKELGDWLMTTGWRKAVESALGNSKRVSTKPPSSSRRAKSTNGTSSPEKSESAEPSAEPQD